MKKDKNFITLKVSLPVIHYAPSGEWGGEKVNCGIYYTTDVRHTGVFAKVTCKRCLGHSK